MKVLFAPDWRNGNAYQSLLAEVLTAEGVEVRFASDYRRVFPLFRGPARESVDLIHLHWPEAYFPPASGLRDWFRLLRFPFDFRLAARRIPFVTTAHNLIPHERPDNWIVRRNQRTAYRDSAAVFAHTDATAHVLVNRYRVDPKRVVVVPHGDLSAKHGPSIPRAEARRQLGLDEQPICLMIGAVQDYKGIEEAIAYWRQSRPAALLAIVGMPSSDAYADELRRLAGDDSRICFHLNWVSDDDFGLWLAAANCVLFNYRRVLTSGGATAARSAGVPILLPRRLDTIDLDEPHPLVFRFDRFDSDFAQVLTRVIATPSDWEAASDWRERTAWPRVAHITAEAYRRCLGVPAGSPLPA